MNNNSNNKFTKNIAITLISSIVISVIYFFSYKTINSPIVSSLVSFFCVFICLFILNYISAQTNINNQKAQDDSATQVTEKMSLVGDNISNKVSGLAISSAEVGFFLDQLAHAIEHSSEDVDRLAASAEEMSANSKQINDHAALASEQSNHAMAASNSSSQQLAGNIEIVTELSVAVNNAADKIKSLEKKALEIQSITDVIDGISGQTNLLSLNAAIEAARAGEQGRGFAVVADEVRALAGKTADATHQIAEMLKQIGEETSQTTSVMSTIVDQTESVVTTMSDLSKSFEQIDQLMTESSAASDQISQALKEQDFAAEEISNSIVNLHDFLLDKSKETQAVSTQASSLSTSTESIFIELSEFDSQTLISSMSQQAQIAAKKIGDMFEQSISDRKITLQQLFDFNYKPMGNVEPKKYTTSFDSFTDQNLPQIQEPLLSEFNDMIYAGAVDINGYFPTHNKCFSKPLTGNPEIDVVNNRTKRLFNDPTGIRCGQHTEKFLLQTYKRDTGEIMHDVSAPIFVQGKHWGAFRIGFKAQ